MKQRIIAKLDELIAECNDLLNLAKRFENNLSIRDDGSGVAKFRVFKTSTLSFLSQTLGAKHEYYKSFDYHVIYFKPYNLTLALEMLNHIRKDVDGGWVQSLKGIVAAELFSDFLEMAEHLLDEGYKDPGAVIIGSVLEENLRELCLRNNIPISTVDAKSGKTKPNKADTMNTDLCKNGVYNLLVQKSVTAWLDLRNNAAHGKYTEYDLSQVKSLLQSVRDFIIKYL